MKYFFQIDTKSFENVSEIVPRNSYRSEVSKNNLGGDLLIDRVGKSKTELSVKINMLSEADMAFIRKCRDKMSVKVSYYEGNTLKEKDMYINPFNEPAPLYFYGDREKGMVYGSLTLKITEI